MGWSAGSFTRVGGSTAWGDDRDASVEIEAGLHDTHDEDLASGIDSCLEKSGSNAMTGDLNFGSNKGINVMDPTSAQDAATKNYVDTASPFISYFAAGDQWLGRLASTPSGWMVGSVNDRLIRIVSGTPGNGGSIAFSTLFAAGKATSAGSAHSHTVTGAVTANSNFVLVQTGSNAQVPADTHTHADTFATANESSHTHTISLAALYHDFRIYQKS